LSAARREPLLQHLAVGAGAVSVDDDPHRNAAIGCRCERVADPQPDVVPSEDVRFEMNRA
jgi:hypothetical protein